MRVFSSDLTSRAAEYKARIDQLASLGRQEKMASNMLADELLEPALVMCEYMGTGEETYQLPSRRGVKYLP